MNTAPTGQKNLQKKLEKKIAPISEAGKIYHCIPTPSNEKSISILARFPKRLLDWMFYGRIAKM